VKKQFLFILIKCMCLQIYAMELDIQKKPFIKPIEKSSLLETFKFSYESLFDRDVQLKLPENRPDAFDKVSAYCTHTSRCNLQLTCKQFYCAASINNLHKLVTHDFVIGDYQEKAAFFKALIKTNNPDLVKPFVYHANQQAKEYVYQFAQFAHLSSLTHSPTEYIQKFYLNPLLKEAIKQDNEIMIKRLALENVDKEKIKKYYDHKCTLWKCLLYTVYCPFRCGVPIGYEDYVESFCDCLCDRGDYI